MDIFVNIPVETPDIAVPAIIIFIVAALILAALADIPKRARPFVAVIVVIFFVAVIATACAKPSAPAPSPEQLVSKGIEDIQQNYSITLSVDQQKSIEEALMGSRKIRVPSDKPSWLHDYADPQAELFPLGTMWIEQEDGSIKEVPYAFRVSPVTEQTEAGEAQGMHIELYAKSVDDGNWDVVSPKRAAETSNEQVNK